MPNKMECFSDRARLTLSYAQEAAERLQHRRIGPEHLLLGLIRDEKGIAGHVLRDAGLEPQSVEKLVAQLSDSGKAGGPLVLADGTKKVLEMAVEEARQMGHETIGTGHLLLGLIRLPDGIANDVLRHAGVSREAIRDTTVGLMTGPLSEQALRDVVESAAVQTYDIPVSGQRPARAMGFTQRARRVLGLAEEAAEGLGHGHVGTEHLLLGLMRAEDGVASRVLNSLNLDSGMVEELVTRLSDAPPKTGDGQPDLSPETRKVLELAVDEARRMGHHDIGTEHLLLGLVRKPDGVAIEILRRLEVTPEEIRSQTRRILQDRSKQ